MTTGELGRWFAGQDLIALGAMVISVGVFALFMFRVPSGIAPATRATGVTTKPAKD